MTRIALQKLDDLMNHRDFIRVQEREEGRVALKFKRGKKCVIDYWGKVTWL